MSDKYIHLLSPIKVGNIVLKNRVFTAPSTYHALQLDTAMGPEESTVRHYMNKARGGAAYITMGNLNCTPLGDGEDGFHIAWNTNSETHMRAMAHAIDAMHFYDARVTAQLGAGMGVPSDANGPGGRAMKGLTRDDIMRKLELFANGARWAKRTGFDSLTVMAGHAAEVGMFLSPHYNKRTDEFGGSFENRTRYLRMIIETMRAEVGRSMTIELRISGEDLQPGGWTLDQTVRIITELAEAGLIDMAQLSNGTNAEHRTRVHPTGFLPPAPNAYCAEYVKKNANVAIPVVALGGIYDPDIAESLIAEGKCDAISSVRMHLADPEIVSKLMTGRRDEARPCIKCFYCLDDYKKTNVFSCAVNPLIGREHRAEALCPSAYVVGAKRVAIVGGGPAGMNAAITAAERGHSVTLFEKDSALGGQLRFSEGVKFKYDLKSYMDYLVHMTEKGAVDIRLNTEATPEMLKSGHFDAVFAAVGANPIVPHIPGVDGENVLSARDVYANMERVGNRVVVVGGGQVGCETALHLAQNGRLVTIVEQLGDIAPDAMQTYAVALKLAIEENGVELITGTACGIIDASGVALGERRIEADTVVIAAGMRADTELAESFRGITPVYRAIGDCFNARNVKWAVHMGFDAAASI